MLCLNDVAVYKIHRTLAPINRASAEAQHVESSRLSDRRRLEECPYRQVSLY